MMLSEKVQVSERFQRSIRIDTDIGDETVINSFVCPQSSAEVLLSMARGRQQAGEAAFTWTGPYGSGKSSLVVILNALLGKEGRLRNKAVKAVGEKQAEIFLKSFGVSGRKGWEFVPIVGHKGNVANALRDALKKISRRKIDNDNLLDSIKEIASEEECGLVIVIDEMGKLLEGAADGDGDIYLFQQLAELSARSKGKIVLLGILHQAFAEYARRLSRDIRDEWSKIQGRFVDLPLNVAGEELIDLIGRAIKSTRKSDIIKVAKITVRNIAQWRPVHAESMAESLAKCWPLHPVTTALLGPISRRRFGQNQRSVFGFLNSAEPHGFQEYLKNTNVNSDALYTPVQLWDYLRANLEPSIMASPDGHKWSLAVEALNRAEANSKDKKAAAVVKCIALMDLFHERSGLAPETDLLSICLPEISTRELNLILETLERQSIIRFKKHKKAYSLYDGSDFDIEASVQGVFEQIPELDFDRIRQAARFQPVVAKRHYHETGALRWLDVDLVPAEQALKVAQNYIPQDGAIGLIMVVLGEFDGINAVDLEKICKAASASNIHGWPIFVSSAENSWLIRSFSKELQALEWIRSNDPSLGGDTVARREVETRLADIRNKLEENLTSTLASAKWHIEGKPPTHLTFKELHTCASEKADDLYNESPKINSELVNRIRPSANSVAALKALLKAMAEKQGESRLGIEGYPAEGGLLETLLVNSGLYDSNLNKVKNPSSKDPCRLLPIWDAADQFFKQNKNRTVPVTELYSVWTAKPFGVKEGLLPFFLMAYLLTRSQNYAVYREGMYKPSIDSLFIDYLTRSPKDIALRSMKFSAIGQKILAGVTDTLNRLHPRKPQLSEMSPPLDIARSLVSTVLDLPPWVLKTRQLSSNAIKLRELIKNASDPNKVLFDDLPNVFKEHEGSLSKGDVQPIIIEVDKSLTELVEAYPILISSFKKQLVDELQIEAKGAFKFGEINMRAKNIMQITGDFKLDAFAARLSTYGGSETDVEGIASLAADKPCRDWIDLDVNRARLRVAELAQQFNHVEAFGRVNNRQDYRQAVAFMVGLNGKPHTFVREFTVKIPQQKIVEDLEERLESLIQKEKKIDNDLLLAALANVGARILEKEEAKSKLKKATA